MDKFKQQKEDVSRIMNCMNEEYDYEAVHVSIVDSDFNMYEKIKDRMDIIDLAKKAITNVGLTPFTDPIRGGTDGARLTYEGLLCPNLGTGGYQFHGRYEFASIPQMKKAVEVLIEIVRLAAS